MASDMASEARASVLPAADPEKDGAEPSEEADERRTGGGHAAADEGEAALGGRVVVSGELLATPAPHTCESAPAPSAEQLAPSASTARRAGGH